jgi:hypothetical protein
VTGFLGTRLFHHRRPYCVRPPAPLPAAAHRLARPILWRHSLLRDLHVRPLHPQHHILASRGRVLLGLLRPDERLLDRHPWMADDPERKRDLERIQRRQRRGQADGARPSRERQEGELDGSLWDLDWGFG